MKKMNNKGLSLIEIMVVVTILGLVVSVGLIGLNTISTRPAQQCAQKIIYSLERHRTTAMGKVDASYILRVEPSHKIVCVERTSNDGVYHETTSEVGTSRVRLSYELRDGSIIPMNPGDTLEFQYDRGSGAFKRMGTDTGDIVRIIAQSGGRDFKVKLVKLTGKVYLDRD